MKIPVADEEGGDLINLTPLIDVVFLLLIFFMVTAKFQEDERDLSVTLPEAENGDPVENLPETILVNVRKDGSYLVGAEVMDRDELRRLLDRARQKNDKQKVIVRADSDAATRHPVGVLDICAGLGIETSIGTSVKEGD